MMIPLKESKGRRLLTVPQFGPTRLLGVLKSQGSPFRACVRGAFWRYHYLRAFSGVDTGDPGVKSDCKIIREMGEISDSIFRNIISSPDACLRFAI